MPQQLTSSILMVSPDTFGYNTQTAASNTFQNQPDTSIESLREKVQYEFKAMTDKLSENGIDVYIVGMDSEYDLPDAVFPNNWFATYEDGTVILFPMLSELRRLERDKGMLEEIMDSSDFCIKEFVDYSKYENEGLILEGTGSLVLDRKHNAVFAIESERTSRLLFERYSEEMKIPAANRVFFHASDSGGNPIYHTNVIMSIGEGFAVICTECIDKSEQEEVLRKLKRLQLEVIEITYDQLNNFCGNLLNVESVADESIIVMSTRAFRSFTDDQKKILEKYGRIVDVDIDTIENVGGGSARCMMAEIFLPKK
ncbi:MAG: amidinotransferase [Ignavibacteria bacterium]|nr:amidinotransferase [Ignavibacteria bacterium]